MTSAARPPLAPSRGILRGLAPSGSVEHRRVAPAGDLAPFVEHFWSVTWALDAPFLAETLPHPTIHVVLERSRDVRAEVTGVPSRRFSRELEGEGRVFGIKFRPAAFQPLFGRPMHLLRDRVSPVEAVLGDRPEAALAALVLGAELDEIVIEAERWLTRVLPPLPASIRETRDLVERMAHDHAIVRVEDAAAVQGIDVRTLERRFRHDVGASPKWVVRRYRLHEAAERLRRPRPPSLAALAADLGYFDQSHFARDFKAVVGRTPKAFARDEARERPEDR